MNKVQKPALLAPVLPVLIWGGLWGICESTIGYFLHLMRFSVGWLVWYPVACFFMLKVYRQTRPVQSILLIGFLSASIKLFNLFLPGSIDRVLNPAVSIAFEAASMAAVLFILRHFSAKRNPTPLLRIGAILCMNTGWRLLYAIYLLLLVPGWMREISVISSPSALCTFFLFHNLSTSLILWAGSIFIKSIFRLIEAAEQRMALFLSSFSAGSAKTAEGIKIAGAVILLGGSAALELLL